MFPIFLWNKTAVASSYFNLPDRTAKLGKVINAHALTQPRTVNPSVQCTTSRCSRLVNSQLNKGVCNVLNM